MTHLYVSGQLWQRGLLTVNGLTDICCWTLEVESRAEKDVYPTTDSANMIIRIITDIITNAKMNFIQSILLSSLNIKI